MSIKTRLNETRLRNAPTHLARTLTAWLLLALGYMTSTTSTLVLLPGTSAGEHLLPIVALSLVASWLPALMAAAYVAGNGGGDA